MKEGREVFYIDGEEVHSGRVTEIEEDREEAERQVSGRRV